MTTKVFKKLIKSRFKELDWLVYTNKDEFFEPLEDNEMAIVGDDWNEVFAITITKVKPD